MNSSLAKLAKYKQIMGAAVAGIILTVIFVPLQTAEAFTVTTTLPGATGNTTTQSASGQDFLITIDVVPGELISISNVDIILDNGQSTVKRTTFNANGQRISGNTDLIKDNTITISIPTPTTTGYGYGYGFAADGYSFSAPYSYTFVNAGYANIGGNLVNYSNAVGDSVTGFVGDGTRQITITGKLITGLMSTTGTRTLDVLVDTGIDANPDILVSNQVSFTVGANPTVVQQVVSSGTNVSLPPINVPGVTTPITVTISNVQTGGTIVVEPKSPTTLQTENPGIFTGVGSSSSFTVGTASGNTIGTILDIDTSAITLGAGAFIDVTIPYDPTLLPPNFDEANVKFFHYNGATWEDVTLSVDTVNNTVTGRLTSLSPVVAGYTSTAPTGGTTPGGTSSGGGGTVTDLTQQGVTYPASYFETRPLAKVQVQQSKFVSTSGQSILAARTGGQVDIQTNFKNFQQVPQDYAIIIQVIDSSGVTADVSWVTGTLAPGEIANAARSWVAGEPDNYTVRIFVWDGISQTPTALSIVNDKTFSVVS